MTLVSCAANESSKCLRHTGTNEPIVIIGATIREASRAVQDIGAWPRHLLHDYQAQGMAWHIHSVAQGVCAQQACMRIITEYVDKRAGINWIDMLGI